MTSLFVSYSRKDIEFARKLTEAFKGQDLDFWIDWEGIPPTVDWWKQIQKGIEESNIFVFLISPDSAQSKICNQEIEHASKNGKRLIPLVVRDIKADEAPAALKSLNWIFLRTVDDFDTSFDKLMTAIRTDYEWVQAHQQLQVKALEWERNNYESSFLLRGKEFQESEAQLVENVSKEPYPTALQREYLQKSKKAADRYRRIVAGITVAGIMALAALAVYGFVQAGLATANANRAEENAATAQAASLLADSNAATAQANAELADQRAKIARAGELVALGTSEMNTSFNLSILLSVEALKTYKNSRTQTSLLNLLNTNSALTAYLIGHTENITATQFSSDGNILASGSLDDTVILWDMSQPGRPQQIATLAGGRDAVTSLAFAPDRKVLASGNLDSAVILWDVSNPHDAKQLSVLESGGASVAFSPSGKILASGGLGHNILLWDVSNPTTPVKQCALTEDDIDAESVVFSPSGTILVSGGTDGTTILWNLTKAGCPIRLSRLAGHKDRITSVTFSKDGKILASGSTDGTIILWDMSNPAQAFKISTLQSSDAVFSLDFGIDGNLLASGNNDRTVVLWDVSDPARSAPFSTLTGHGNSVSSVAFSSDGRHLASGDSDGAVILWSLGDAFSALRLSKISSPLETVLDVEFNPQQKIIATRGCESFADTQECNDTIIFWDLADSTNPAKISSIPMHGDKNRYSNDIAFDPTGMILAAADCLDIDPEQHCLESNVSLWDVKSPLDPLLISVLPSRAGDTFNLVFSPDARTLVQGNCGKYDTSYVCQEGEITLWDIKGASHPVLLSSVSSLTSEFFDIAFSPDGKSLASVSCWLENEDPNCKGGEITLWNLHDLKKPTLYSFVHDPVHRFYNISFVPNSQFMISGDDYGDIIVWNVSQPGNPIKISTQSEHDGPMYSMSTSSDGKYLTTGSCAIFGDANLCIQGEFILWDVSDPSTPTRLMTFLDHADLVNTVAFSSDSMVLASASDDGSISFWDTDPTSWIKKSCQRAGRVFSTQEWIKFFPGESYRFTCPDAPISINSAIEIVQYSMSIQDENTASLAYRRVIDESKNSQDAANLNQLCWFGSLDGFSEIVLPACNRAVEIAIQQNDNDDTIRYRDSRGLARALTGDTDGAIEDFSAFVTWTQNNTFYEQARERRIAWIRAMQAGGSPFTPDVLEELRSE